MSHSSSNSKSGIWPRDPQCFEMSEWVDFNAPPDTISVFWSRVYRDLSIKNWTLCSRTHLAGGSKPTTQSVCRWPSVFCAIVMVSGLASGTKGRRFEDLARSSAFTHAGPHCMSIPRKCSMFLHTHTHTHAGDTQKSRAFVAACTRCNLLAPDRSGPVRHFRRFIVGGNGSAAKMALITPAGLTTRKCVACHGNQTRSPDKTFTPTELLSVNRTKIGSQLTLPDFFTKFQCRRSIGRLEFGSNYSTRDPLYDVFSYCAESSKLPRE